MPSVTLNTGGTHPPVTPGEAAVFLEQFLESSGYSENYSWEARIERTGHSSSESPPVRVVGFKHWVIYIRVKPAIDAATDFYVSLMIPDGSGYIAEDVYRQFKGNVRSFNRLMRTNNTKTKPTEPAMKTETVSTVQTPRPIDDANPDSMADATGAPSEHDTNRTTPAATSPASTHGPVYDTLEFETLTGVTRHPEKLRYVLTFVDQVSKIEAGSAMSFKKSLRKAAGWSNQPIRAVALVLAWLCKHDFVVKIRDDQDQVVNYRLTPRGASLAFSGMGAASGPAPESLNVDESSPQERADMPDLDPGTLLIRFRDKAQELADAGRRLETNRERYRDLQAQLKHLDEEYNEIARILVANREASALLCRLLELQGSVPIRS